MTMNSMARLLCTCATVVATTAVSAASVRAQNVGFQTSPCDMPPGAGSLFSGTVSDLRRLPSRGTLGIATVGAAAAFGAHAADTRTSRSF